MAAKAPLKKNALTEVRARPFPRSRPRARARTRARAETRLARLYVASDILHNAAACGRGARMMRSLLRPYLAAALHHLGTRLLGQTGSTLELAKTNSIIDKVNALLQVWGRWAQVFPANWTFGLESAFFERRERSTTSATDEEIDEEALRRDARIAGLYDGAAPADSITPEAIVRARFSAYVKNVPKYIVASTHPDSKDMKRKDDPAEAREQLEKDADATMQKVQFKSLRVKGTKEGDGETFVTYEVSYKAAGKKNRGGRKTLAERSRYKMADREFKYFDALPLNSSSDMNAVGQI